MIMQQSTLVHMDVSWGSAAILSAYSNTDVMLVGGAWSSSPLRCSLSGASVLRLWCVKASPEKADDSIRPVRLLC